jgi:hypothetical protein
MFLENSARLTLIAISLATLTASAKAQFVQQHIIAVESWTPASAKALLQGNTGQSVQLAGNCASQRQARSSL